MKSRMAITIGCARSGVACGSQHRIGAGYHADRPLVGGAEQLTQPKLMLPAIVAIKMACRLWKGCQRFF
jgi:hypothetical protein